MDIKVGDFVTRNSYNNDTLFKVINIKDGLYYLKGVEVRLCADSFLEDLKKVDNYESDSFERSKQENYEIDKEEYFYLPAKIWQIDGAEDDLEKCIKLYRNAGVYAVGKKVNESNMQEQVPLLLKEYKPDIIIITGHDAYFKKKGDLNDLANYKNTANFIKAVKQARKYEKSHEKLVIIAGACQSNYEELIKAGANFASSPKRVNIHALDPAIIAVTLALTERNKEIDLKNLLDKTKYGSDGMGGLVSNGLMYVGYPR